MRRVVMVGLMVVIACAVNAQTFDEWFRQKKTQIRYLTEQIAALRAYGAVVNKGYEIAQNGLTNIFHSKDGDFKQHHDYLLSLWKVKPGIQTYSKVLAIYQMKAAIDKQQQLLKVSVTDFLAAQERDHLNAVYAALVSDCNNTVNDLAMVIRDDQLQLKDDERIDRIDKLYLQMKEACQFSQSFTRQVKLLVLSRLKEKAEVNKLSDLYGVK